MTEQNTAMIQEMYAAFGRGDIQTILDHLSEDVHWVYEGPSIIPHTGTRNGKAEVLQFFEAFKTLRDHKLTIDEYIAQGDKVVTTGRFSAVVVATGKSFDTAIAHVFTVQGGKVTDLLDFADTARVAEAYAGLA
jgi:ketosteroid isomerase-like protein